MNFPAEEEYPDLSLHSNHMAKMLTPELRAKSTPSGFTLNEVIQTGVYNQGHRFIMTVDCVVGDEESYKVFKALFNPVTEDHYSSYQPSDKHKTNFNLDNLQGGDDLDPNYALSSRVCKGHGIRSFGLPPHSRPGKCCAVEKLAVEAQSSLAGDLASWYYMLNSMTKVEQWHSSVTISFLTSPCHHCCWPPAWPTTGPTPVASGAMTTRPS